MPRLRGGMAKAGAALVLAAGALVAGCGGDDAGSSGLAALVPPDVPFYAESVLRPDGDHADAIESFAERVGGITDPGATVVAELDASFADDDLDLNYADDIEPWLGSRAGAFVSSFEDGGDTPDFAVMAEVEDADAASDFVQKLIEQSPDEAEERTYEDTGYFVTGGFAVGVLDESALAFGSETGLKVAIDAGDGESLAESDEYTERLDQLPDDPLVSFFVEPAAAIEASIMQGDVDPATAQVLEPLLGGALSQPIAATLTATADTASFEFAAMFDSATDFATESSLLTELPGESWFAAAVPDLGSSLEESLDQLSSSGLPGAGEIERQVMRATGLDLGEDVFGWLGDAAAFVEGTAAPGFSAGLIAQTSDPEAPGPLLEVLRRIAERDSGLRSSGPPEGSDVGFSLGIPGIGGGAEAGVIGDQLVAVVGATVDQALNPSETLGDNPEFEEAVASLGDDLAPALFVSLPELFQVAELGADGDVDYEAIRPYLDAFSTLVGGARVEDGLTVARITVSLADE